MRKIVPSLVLVLSLTLSANAQSKGKSEDKGKDKGGDLVAMPEPSQAVELAAGGVALSVLLLRRKKASLK